MKKILDQIMILCSMAAALFCFISCSDDLDIQQEYPFTVEAMPVADKIAGGQTVEITQSAVSVTGGSGQAGGMTGGGPGRR